VEEPTFNGFTIKGGNILLFRGSSEVTDSFLISLGDDLSADLRFEMSVSI